MKHTISLCLAITISTVAFSQKHQKVIKKEISFKSVSLNNTLIIDNVSGFIKVESTSGNKVILEVIEQISARSQSKLTKALEDLELKVNQFGDTIEIYIDGLCHCDCNRKNSHYGWNNCNNDIDYTYDFIVTVPRNVNLLLSTVNDGDIRVANVTGGLSLKNVNGGIFVKGAQGEVGVHTINGDIEVKFNSVPSDNSSFYTLNGDLEVFLPKNLNADMSFKSFNGEFYTDFDVEERMPSRVVTSNNKDRGANYKIDDITAVRVGTGGLKLDFETFNGDIYIKKNQ